MTDFASARSRSERTFWHIPASQGPDGDVRPKLPQ